MYGLLQAIGDGVKLVVKETTIPVSAERSLFIISPILTFLVSISIWSVIPVGEGNAMVDA